MPGLNANNDLLVKCDSYGEWNAWKLPMLPVKAAKVLQFSGSLACSVPDAAGCLDFVTEYFPHILLYSLAVRTQTPHDAVFRRDALRGPYLASSRDFYW